MPEPDVSKLLSVADAIRIIDATPVEPRIVLKPLDEAVGLRLAEDLSADRDYPPFDKSLMDGYAIRTQDIQAAPVELTVIGEISAGQSSSSPVGRGQAMAIMTGAPIPPGADGVVPVEDVEKNGVTIRIMQAAPLHRYISGRGSDIQSGTVVLSRGIKLEAAQLAVAASIGAAQVNVFDAPRAAVLGTGDELVPITSNPRAEQIRNSNNLMLLSLLHGFGCSAVDLGTVPDDRELIRRKLLEGLEHDLLFVTGGMSMGAYDYVPQLLAEIGVDLKITKLRIKPGKPFLFGTWRRKSRTSYVFGLPGNPVSSYVCTIRLARRLIDRLSGGGAEDHFILANLSSPLPPNGPREFYQPAILYEGAVRPLLWKGSADIYTLAAANCMIVRAENEPAIAAGTQVRVLLTPQ